MPGVFPVIAGAPSGEALAIFAELNEKIDTTQAFTVLSDRLGTDMSALSAGRSGALRCPIPSISRAALPAPAGDGAARKAEPARTLPSGWRRRAAICC